MILALLAALSSTAPAAHCPSASVDQVRQEFARWMKAYDDHDLAGTMAIFDPSVRFEFQGSPDQSWKDLEQGYMRGFARPGRATWLPAWDQVLVSDKLATAFSTWRAMVTDPGGNPYVRSEYRGVDVLQRGDDCRWRIVHSLNFSLKTAPAPSAK